MSFTDVTFDWKGLKFAFKLCAFCFVVGIGVYHISPFVMTEESSAIAVPVPLPVVEAQDLPLPVISGTAPPRVINTVEIADVVPAEGKMIAADLKNMRLHLFENGVEVATYPVVAKGRLGTHWETPAGLYRVEGKEREHFSTIGRVYMPYSLQFYGNYFIHGQTYYPDGRLRSAPATGGCIRVATEDAKKVFEFAQLGTQVFVYDPKQDSSLPPLMTSLIPVPRVSAQAYLVADIDTGDVYAEKGAQARRPIASISKLMTALVASETISFDKKLSVSRGGLMYPADPSLTSKETFAVGDLLYPLLLLSSNPIADSLAAYYGTDSFVNWMNKTARGLNMRSTYFADPSGLSSENVSTAEDLFRLATYLVNKKPFILSITHTHSKTITAADGSEYQIGNVNAPADAEAFVGGKAGYTRMANGTMFSVFSFEIGGDTRRIAVILLDSDDRESDTKRLASWIASAAKGGASMTSCVSCTKPDYRKIDF